MPMDSGIVDQMRSAIGNYLLPHRHTALLVAIVTLLGVRPLIGSAGAGNAVFSVTVDFDNPVWPTLIFRFGPPLPLQC